MAGLILAIEWLKQHPWLISTPGVLKISKLPKEIQLPYWQLIKIHLSVTWLHLNLIFAYLILGSVKIAQQEWMQLSPIILWGPVLSLIMFIIYYSLRLARLSRLLVRKNQNGR